MLSRYPYNETEKWAYVGNKRNKGVVNLDNCQVRAAAVKSGARRASASPGRGLVARARPATRCRCPPLLPDPGRWRRPRPTTARCRLGMDSWGLT